jgi:hypothetical protein
MTQDEKAKLFNNLFKINLILDQIKRTLGEGTFGKVVEVKDLKK